MKPFIHYSPIKTIYNSNCVITHKNELIVLGKKALIVTGVKSHKANGALDDITTALKDVNIDFVHVAGASVSMSLDTLNEWAGMAIAENIDCVIGVGGGTAMDAAKIVAVLVANPDCKAIDLVEDNIKFKRSLPIATIPTTIGNGANSSKYAVLPSDGQSARMFIKPFNNPIMTFIDSKYDIKADFLALSHGASSIVPNLFAAYLSDVAGMSVRMIVEETFFTFGKCIEYYGKEDYPEVYVQGLMLASTWSGITVSQTGPSLIHFLAFELCQLKKISYCHAAMILSVAVLKLSSETMDIMNLLNSMWMKNFEDYQATIDATAKKITATDDEIDQLADEVFKYHKQFNFSAQLDRDDIVNIYKSSLS